MGIATSVCGAYQRTASAAKLYGLTRDGFFAESKAMLPRSLIPIPSNVTDEEAAIVEPVALALRVLNHLQPNLGDWVTVVGQGPIGLLMTQVALLKGCRVIAVDLEDYRLELSEKYGADAVINAKKEDVPKTVRKLTKMGSDFVIEAAGTTTDCGADAVFGAKSRQSRVGRRI